VENVGNVEYDHFKICIIGRLHT